MIRSAYCNWLAAAAAQFIVVALANAQTVVDDSLALLAASGCAACHGPAGLGTALAPPIVGPALSEEEFRAGVRNARGSMPSYSVEVLSDGVLDALYAYSSAHEGIGVPVGRVARGAEVYERVGCYSCHSNQGQGIMHGPRIAPNPIRWGRFVWYIRHPSGQMPPYSPDVLSDQDLADIYAFLRRRVQPQPVESIPLLAP
ncbi:MAG: cytochrome c [Gammaproteobacteria bacterium]|nr:cytochrome c [Gammaproteobacteria bacterium]MDH3508721.1 cytochrome c [Gammaproteobacteria bacterium]